MLEVEPFGNNERIDQPILFLTKPFFKMKKLLFLFASTLLLANLFVSTGCEDDPVEPDVKNPPSVTVSLTSAATIAPGEAIVYSVTADKGTDPLASMTITEDGTDVDASRITIENIAVANNPQLITDADKQGLVYNITITGSDTPGDYTYETTVTDDGGLTDSDVFTVTVEDPTTPLSMDISGVLFNQAGPTGTGGLDLDIMNGGTGSADPSAEIRDWGIDTALPVDQNWRRQIGAALNHTMLFVGEDNTGEINFDAVTTVEAVADNYSKGTALVDNKSNVVIVGDVFAVQNADTGRLYLIRIDEVNTTPADNNDNYVISIKY